MKPIENWERIYSELKKNKEIIGIAPFIESQSLLTHQGEVFGAKSLGSYLIWKSQFRLSVTL